jgi:hypothetical protein
MVVGADDGVDPIVGTDERVGAAVGTGVGTGVLTLLTVTLMVEVPSIVFES